MTETPLLDDPRKLDDPRTVDGLTSVARVFRWVRSLPAAKRKRFLAALAECSDEIQDVVIAMFAVVEAPDTSDADRKRALMTIADALFLNPDEEDGAYGQDLAGSEAFVAARSGRLAREVGRLNSQEEAFAARLQHLMDAKKISQRELADRVGCSQPAISQMLRRTCRPQKKTILRLAEALNVAPRDLWPDIEVADMLDAVAEFQRDDYVMSPAEAAALSNASNRPKIRPKVLPLRP